MSGKSDGLISARLLQCLAVFPIMFAGACSLPRDPSGTMDRVERTHELRLGMVEGARFDEPSRKTLDKVLNDTGASVQLTRGDSEELLHKLEQGEIDLVFGEFATDSPWKTSVHLAEPAGLLGKPPKSEAVPRFAMMNGENGWIMKFARASQ